jgi:hypothetical protein
MLDGLYDFKDKMEAVQKTLGVIKRSKSIKKTSDKKEYPKPVALEKEKAVKIFNQTSLVNRAIDAKWLSGTIKLVKVWPYYNEKGLIEIVDARYENDKGKKAVISFYYDGKALRNKGIPVVLYNRHKLEGNDLPVLIVEGAKAAEAAENIPGFIPVTWNGGGKKCKYVKWSALKGRTVYIYPDDDQKHYDSKHHKAGQLLPSHNQPGIATAFQIKKKLPKAKIVKPLEEARTIKADGADIVEALQASTPEELSEYIKNGPEILPPASPESPLDTPKKQVEQDFFPFRILGVADDGKGYFLDRHERLTSMGLSSINQNKMLTLAPLTFWIQAFAEGKGGVMLRDDWTTAIDAVIQLAGLVDFDPDIIRGRGAWREKDGRLCYHDGLNTIGESSPERLYLRMTRKDIGLDSPYPDLSHLKAILEVTGQLSFETRADMIRCIAWSTLSPFAGALPWRPAGLLTGQSESGKSTIVDMIIKPLSLPFVFSGGETTEAGIRQTIKNDASAIVVEESETDTPKKRQRRDDTLSLMRQSTSDETPKAAKGTIDGRGMMFTLRSMFMFVAISPEIESVADDNRLFRVNLEKNDNDWASLKIRLGDLITPDICAGIRALTWSKLQDIFTMADKMIPIIQEVTHKSARFATAEAMLFATYQIIWKQKNLSEDELHKFFKQIYAWQPPEQGGDETEELLDKLLDSIVQEGREKYTLREILQKLDKGYDKQDMWRAFAGRYGLGITSDGELAIAKNHPEIMRLIERGRGYQRMFYRHRLLKERERSIYIAGKTRNCLILEGLALKETVDTEPF